MSRLVGVDVGERRTRVVEGRGHRGGFEVVTALDVDNDDLAGALAEAKIAGARAVVGVTGRDMILRTTPVPALPAWKLGELIQVEIDDIAEQSGDALSADWRMLGGAPADDGEDRALLALMRDSLIEERTDLLTAADLKLSGFSPNAIALSNAFAVTDGRHGSVMVASIGDENTDIALVEDGELVFARNLSGGQGTATRQITGMLQSTLSLARTQLARRDLALDRVLLSGVGARTGLDDELTEALGVPVELFDPTEGHGAAFAVAAGLAMTSLVPPDERLEVLSAEGRKARAFRDKTAWLVASAALVALLLVLDVVILRGDALAAERDARGMRQEVENRRAALVGFERARADVAEQSLRLRALESLTAPGSGVLAALDLLAAHLPDELWVTAVRTARGVVPEFGHGDERRPYVLVSGRGKEVERNLADAVTELTERLRSEPSVAAILPQFTTDSRGDFVFELRLDTSLFPQGEP